MRLLGRELPTILLAAPVVLGDVLYTTVRINTGVCGPTGSGNGTSGNGSGYPTNSTTAGVKNPVYTSYGEYYFDGFYPVTSPVNAADPADPGSILNGRSGSSASMTLEYCGQTFCGGSKYFAVANGDQCYCGSDPPTGSRVDSPDPATSCPGDKTETCGSPGYAIVYQNEGRGGDLISPPGSATSTPASGPITVVVTGTTTDTAGTHTFTSTSVVLSTSTTSVTASVSGSGSPSPSTSSSSTSGPGGSSSNPVLSSSSTTIIGGGTSGSSAPLSLPSGKSSATALVSSSSSTSASTTETGSSISAGKSSPGASSITVSSGSGSGSPTSSPSSTNSISGFSSTTSTGGSSSTGGSISTTPASSSSTGPSSSTSQTSSSTGSSSTGGVSSSTSNEGPSSTSSTSSPTDTITSVSSSTPGASSSPTGTPVYTFTSAVEPIVTSTPSCGPGSTSNNTEYQDIFGYVYHIKCGRQLVGKNLLAVHADDFSRCLEYCDLLTGCVATTYLDGNNANDDNTNCYPYSAFTGYSDGPEGIYSGVSDNGTSTGYNPDDVVLCGTPTNSGPDSYPDGGQYSDSFGNTYTLACNQNVPGTGSNGDLAPYVAVDLFACITYCSIYAPCVGVDFTGYPVQPNAANCYPKRNLGQPAAAQGTQAAYLA